MCWSFRRDRDFETMSGGRGSFRTRDCGVRGGWNIHLGPRSLWRRVETGKLDISSTLPQTNRSESSRKRGGTAKG